MTEPEDPCICVLCRPGCTGHVGDNRNVCGPCRRRQRDLLADVVPLYALLEEEVTSRGSAGPKVSGSRAAPVPGNLDVLNLRGPGSMSVLVVHVEDHYGASPVFAALETWERDWRNLLGWPVTGVWPDLPTALTAIVRFLDAQLDWACDHHPAIDEFALELRGVVGSMRAARGDRPESIYVGRCPSGEPPCNSRLYADTWHDVIRCGACRTEWPQSQWVLLGRVMGA